MGYDNVELTKVTAKISVHGVKNTTKGLKSTTVRQSYRVVNKPTA